MFILGSITNFSVETSKNIFEECENLNFEAKFGLVVRALDSEIQ